MSDRAGRLANCFAVVFPELSAEKIHAAEVSNVPQWDSLRHITLLTVVGEEFETEMPLEDLEQLGSYQNILNFLDSTSRDHRER